MLQGELIAIVGKPYDEWWEGYTVGDPETKGLFCILLVDQQPLGKTQSLTSSVITHMIHLTNESKASSPENVEHIAYVE